MQFYHLDVPDYSKVFYLSKFPVDWKTHTIISKFKDVGVHVNWIDDTSAFVIVRDPVNVHAMREFTQKPVGEYRLQSWEQYQSSLSQVQSSGLKRKAEVDAEDEREEERGGKQRKHFSSCSRGVM